MTYEEFKTEMRRRGATTQQSESQSAAIAFDILNGVQEHATKIRELDQEFETARHRNDREIRRLSDAREATQALFDDVRNNIAEFEKALLECETAESRDALRTAQFYVNNTNVETKYDNTAFIVGLAAILTGMAIDPNIELKKINKSLVTRPTVIARL